ncbi:MAG: 4Fe-4S dicluster domain-containing protein [Candidatus Aminicenantes bacterium]|nr:4Fe-4S dicluster domain-containing protein [Candidatus Aminicenantes bacterium]
MIYVNLSLLILCDAFLIVLIAASISEKEKQAGLISLAALLINSLLWPGFIFFAYLRWVGIINLILLGVLLLFGVFSLLRFFPAVEERDVSAAEQYDERDHMLARNRLKNLPEAAAKYYAAHPEKKEIDKKIHAKPNLGEPGSTYYDKIYSPLFEAAFTNLERTRSASMAEENSKTKNHEKVKLHMHEKTGKAPEQKFFGGVKGGRFFKKASSCRRRHEKTNSISGRMTAVIEETARFYGAVDVGITPLKPYHFYSHVGRREEHWGEAVKSDHRFAIVIVVAMDVDMIKAAPGLPVVLESSRQYVEAAKIANILAEYIRSFGCDARAHTDGNYQVLCVPLAVDSGVGVLGRLGLLLHPVYGPCVRISVVTTDIELLPTPKEKKFSPMETFCRICKKCADNCPSRAITHDEEPVSRGVRHWSIAQEQCFSMWKKFGTDCGLCISVCPYTKPDTLVHKLVRFYVSRNPVNQRLALFFDDLLYGRRPTRVGGQ